MEVSLREEVTKPLSFEGRTHKKEADVTGCSDFPTLCGH